MNADPAATFPIANWLQPEDLDRYADYWNAEAAERGKPFDLSTGDFARLDEYVRAEGYDDQLAWCLDTARRQRGRGLTGRGADLACGVAWIAPRLLAREPDVRDLACVDYSRHRVTLMAPRLLARHGVDPARVTLALGSFYSLPLETGALDFVVLSAAFHHADDPARLLAETRRLLAPGGVALLIGEPLMVVTPYLYVRTLARMALARVLPLALQRRLLGRTLARGSFPPATADVFPPDPVLGDHYHTPEEYDAMFEAAGFQAVTRRWPAHRCLSFVLASRGH